MYVIQQNQDISLEKYSEIYALFMNSYINS